MNNSKSSVEEHTILIGIGSNVGDRIENIVNALEILQRECDIVKVSTVYESQPWGIKDQPSFLNCVAEIKTKLSPFELLDFLKETEVKVGRKERFRWGPREIDLDILFFEDKVIKTEKLTIPHPRIYERDFVVYPLLELCGENFVDPEKKKKIKDLISVKNNLKPFCCLTLYGFYAFKDYNHFKKKNKTAHKGKEIVSSEKVVDGVKSHSS